MLAAAAEPADEVIEGAERINMSSDAFERFVAALDGPPEEIRTLYVGVRTIWRSIGGASR